MSLIVEFRNRELHETMNHLRQIFSVLGTLGFWTLTGTVSAIAFGMVYAMLLLTALFGHPLFFYGGLMLGPFAGAIGGPVFGFVYGITLARRNRIDQRRRSMLLSGVLGGVIFALVGVGFSAWEASERSHQPTKRPLPAPNADQVVERQNGRSSSGGSIQATPDGGQVLELRERTIDSGRSIRAVSATLSVTALGGFLYGALFSAIVGVKRLEGELP